jgi:hypothetical protein
MGWWGSVSIKFISAEFLDAEDSGRVNKCRELAIEADALATAAFNEEMRANYLELKRQWDMLADEIELAERSRRRI